MKKVNTGIINLFKRGRSFKLPQEDFPQFKISFTYVKISEFSNSILALFGFLSGLIACDISNSDSSPHTEIRDILLISCTISTLLLLLSIYWRTQCLLNWEKSRSLYSSFDTIFSSGKLKVLLFEFLVNLPHPSLPLKQSKFTSYNDIYNIYVDYSYNHILTIISILRIYHFIRLYSVFSKYRSDRAYRVCSMKGKFAGTSWTIKCLMHDSPFTVIFIVLAFGVLIGGYCLRIFESSLDPYTNYNFSVYKNALWCVIITMTTVGYGDYYLSTLPGRIIGLFACIYGVLVISIMVYSVTNLLNLSTFEEKTLSLYRKLEFQDEFKTTAVNMLISAYRYKQYCRKNKSDKEGIAKCLSKFRRRIKDFQRSKFKKKTLYNFNTIEDNVDRKINYLCKLIRFHKDERELINDRICRFSN